MPSAIATSGGTAQTTGAPQERQPVTSVTPFRRATREHMEPVTSYTQTLTAAFQSPPTGPISIPAYGYARGVWVKLTATGGVGASVFQENGVWGALQNLMITEPNGAQISQFSSSFGAYLAQKWLGYRGYNNPKASYFTQNTANGNFTAKVFLPFELNERDGLGSLPNQNAAAMFVLKYQLANLATIYSTPPGTPPSVLVEIFADEYDQPAATSDNSPNATTPPSMNTTQFWSEQTYPVVLGYNKIRLTRVGNYLRGLIFQFNAATRALGETNWPAQTTINYDSRPVTYLDKAMWRDLMYQRSGYSAGAATALEAENGQDSGVFVYDLCHEFDGRTGHENRDGWWKTFGSTRLELEGTFGAAGTLTVYTNDVSIASNVFLG